MSDKNGEKVDADSSKHQQQEETKHSDPTTQGNRPSYPRNDMLDSPYSIYMSQTPTNNNPYQIPNRNFPQQNYGYNQQPAQYQQQYPPQQPYYQPQYAQQRKLRKIGIQRFRILS